MSFWATLNSAQKNYYYNKLSQQKCRIRDRAKTRAAWANMPPEKKARIYARERARRLENLDEERRKDREWRQRNAEKIRARERAEYWRNHQKHQERHRRRWAKQRSQKQITLSPDAVFRIIDKAVPKVLPRFVRDDIISAMCLAVLDGQLFVENIGKEASKFVSAYNREYDSFKTVSLDAPLAGYDGLTLLDRLADPHLAGE
ncbi:hypothetical protein [Rhizobium mesosinicum]|uniref:Uncharacterized protein n=1 Tax=Rhizobium mesosinicum TaxID=335017 RepID=A0ABS7GVT7_9HYPH|nr:hypothetical protein [Rhizobium mesosinicum]MBW9053485.1 hypothetical protein [Rhizobium mesosinicum]